MSALDRTLHVWRHPRAQNVDGRCIGSTDVRVDRRRAKRLAHRIRRHARRHGLPRLVITSPLRRSADVGRWLATWGWEHRIDAALAELDFGAWDGLRWSEVDAEAIDAWCADFMDLAPGGGEALAALFERCRGFVDALPPRVTCCAVGHAGWITAARWLAEGRALLPRAADWPQSVAPGQLTTLFFPGEAGL